MKIKTLLKNLCCSICKANFDENSITIIREEKNLLVISLKCNKCGKDFGTAFLELKKGTKELQITNVANSVNYKDVTDNRGFMEELNKNWSKYLK